MEKIMCCKQKDGGKKRTFRQTGNGLSYSIGGNRGAVGSNALCKSLCKNGKVSSKKYLQLTFSTVKILNVIHCMQTLKQMFTQAIHSFCVEDFMKLCNYMSKM